MHPNFQISGSKTKLFQSGPKQTAITPSLKTTKLLNSLRNLQSPDEEINFLSDFIDENSHIREFRQSFHKTLFLNIMNNRLLNQDWVPSASHQHFSKLFQTLRLLSRETSLLVFIFLLMLI
jgi:hypothetical protein